MASWNSVPLEITYQVLGWTSFLSWTMGFYPQVILNFRRKRYYYYNTNKKIAIFFLGLDFVSSWYAWLLILWLGFLCWGVNVVWWGWASILWCWIWRSTPRIWYTTRPSSLAPLFRSSTTKSTAMERFVLSSCRIKKHIHFKLSTRNRNSSSLGFSMHVVILHAV